MIKVRFNMGRVVEMLRAALALTAELRSFRGIFRVR
jgi:hypothetical protein